jgi:hypothetical protein
MADHPSHTLLFVTSDVPDSTRQFEEKQAISQVEMRGNSDGGCNSITSQAGEDGLSPVFITRTNNTPTTAKERCSAWYIQRKERKAEKRECCN